MSYRGKELLRIMQNAANYNNFIVSLILKSLNNKSQKILDFGSGYGYFAELLRKKGVLNIKCVEIDDELSEHCKNLDFEVFNNLNQIEDNSFDFMYTLNVLEHIEKDEEVLILLRNKLKKGGKLFIYVPAFQALYSSFDKNIGHYKRYNKKDLAEFLLNNGFEIQSAKYFDSCGFILALLYKFLNKKNGQISSAQIFIFDKFLFPIGLIFDKLTGGRFFGKNLIIEAELKFDSIFNINRTEENECCLINK